MIHICLGRSARVLLPGQADRFQTKRENSYKAESTTQKREKPRNLVTVGFRKTMADLFLFSFPPLWGRRFTTCFLHFRAGILMFLRGNYDPAGVIGEI